MTWPDVRAKLLDVAQRLKQSKAIDIGIKQTLQMIPVVGGFVAEYWSRLEVQDEAHAQELAAFLEKLAEQQELYERVERRLESQGQMLINMQTPLMQLLSDIEEIGEDTAYTRRVLERWDEALRLAPARHGMALGLAMAEDSKRGALILEDVNKAIEATGAEMVPSTYYMLGMMYAGRYEYESAEASLLAATGDEEIEGAAYLGLSINSQRWANELITQENFGLAEDVLQKSEAYVKEAIKRAPLDAINLNQLGYTYKDLAIRYQFTGKAAAAEQMFAKASEYFGHVLKEDPNDASAHNGIGGVALMGGDYDKGIAEIRRAIELQQDYREAFFDLAQAYYYKSRQTQDPEVLIRGLEAYRTILTLESQDRKLPDHALERLNQLYGPVLNEPTGK